MGDKVVVAALACLATSPPGSDLTSVTLADVANIVDRADDAHPGLVTSLIVKGKLHLQAIEWILGRADMAEKYLLKRVRSN